MTNVRWVAAITAVDSPFRGYQHTTAYRLRETEDADGEPVTRMTPRSWCPPASPTSHPGPRTGHGRCTLSARAWSGVAPMRARWKWGWTAGVRRALRNPTPIINSRFAMLSAGSATASVIVHSVDARPERAPRGQQGPLRRLAGACAAGQLCGKDVGVDPEKVVGVVLLLDLTETSRVGAIRVPRERVSCLVGLPGEVGVRAALAELRYLVEGVPHPGDVRGVVVAIFPVAVEGRHPLRGSFAVRGVCGTHPVDRTTHVEHDRQRRG